VSFRARLTIAAAAAVAAAIALAAPVVYVVVRNELLGQVDDSLRERATSIARIPLRPGFDARGRVGVTIPHGPFGDPGGYVQYVDSRGTVATPDEERYAGEDVVKLPVGPGKRVAAGSQTITFNDATVAGTHVRMVTVPTETPGIAVQVARSLEEVDATLGRVRNLLLAVVLAGIALATAFGALVARAALAPVRRLTEATEHVTETRDLSARLDEHGSDELSRLSASFNRMMGALESSQRAQRQLVADASHELRTPLTSMRTNIEVLALDRELPQGERERLLADVVDQFGEMAELIGELTELARGERERLPHEEVRLDLVAAEAARRTRRNHPDATIDEQLEETTVVGDPVALDRAIGNLLDNAAKWSPPGVPIELRVAGGEVVVRDHGPGIDECDAPHVLDRFYRADAARSMPGSGLGLAIVRQVAESHGGSVTAERPEDGGTLMQLRLSSPS
jgi:two-component system sensor histidine kinase MprB